MHGQCVSDMQQPLIDTGTMQRQCSGLVLAGWSVGESRGRPQWDSTGTGLSVTGWRAQS